MYSSSSLAEKTRRRRVTGYRQRLRRALDRNAGKGVGPGRILDGTARLVGIAVTAVVVTWGLNFALEYRATSGGEAGPAAGGLWNIHQAAAALTPDNIEHWVLTLALEMQQAELWARPTGDSEVRPFTIYPGEPARYIAYRLESEGYVSDAELFNLYLRVEGLEHYLSAGNFLLSGNMTMPEVALALQIASYDEVSVTIPEGLRMEQIAARLAESHVIDAETFLGAVTRPRALTVFDDYAFLYDLPPGESLEGFLFPDTYRFPVNTERVEPIVAKFLDNFDTKFGQRDLIRSGAKLPGRDLVTLASIIEREVVLAEERPLVSSVYYNRLEGRCNDEVRGPYLESDPTVQYPLGNAETGWWPPIQIAHYTTVESRYNTFLNPGLPPGPIANPGLDSLNAALQPAVTVYCFFHTAGPGGGHAFARTFAEHQANIDRYGNRP